MSGGTSDVSTAVSSNNSARPTGGIPALTIMSHPSGDRVGERLVLEAVAAGRAVPLSRNAPDFTKPGRPLGVPLSDPFLSRNPIRFSAGVGGRVALTASGTTSSLVVDGRPMEAAELAPEEIARGVVLELAKRVVLLLHHTDRDAGDAADAHGMIGDSAGIRRVRGAIDRVVDLTVPVLIRGETGTGKELVARAIHDRGPRSGGPFVSVNLGALPRELAAAELFGSVKGAYTGASRDRRGLFAMADGGTLFLDEVGEAPAEVQVLLLRVLETGELYPVGADKPIATHVRLIAATDADLEVQIRDGKFKAPLLHRLSGYEIRIPPLRERRDDIGPLLYHFARQELAAIGEAHRLAPADPHDKAWLPAPIAAQLVRYAWPGNIRQLRNLTRQLVIENRGQPQVLSCPFLPEDLAEGSDPAGPVARVARAARAPAALGSARRRRPADVTDAELVEVLQRCAWNLRLAADQLGIPRPSIYDLIDKNPKIRLAGDLDADEIIQCFQRLGGDLDAMVAQLQVSKWGLSRRIKELGLTPGG